MLTIFAVSDSIGETAEQVAIAAASQFKDKAEVKRIPYVKSFEDVEELIKNIDTCTSCMVVSTIITVNVREFLTEKCIEKNINIINVLGPIINVASTILNTHPDYNPGAMWKTDEMYFKRIEAMEFAMQYNSSGTPTSGTRGIFIAFIPLFARYMHKGVLEVLDNPIKTTSAFLRPL